MLRTLVLALVTLSTPALADAQSDAEAVMIAAGRWALERAPSGAVRLDPHRTGNSRDQAVAQRVARALGAELGTLEETRTCANPMAPETCALDAAALVAVSAPRLSDDRARVHVYLWFRQESATDKVGKGSWELTLRRTASGWQVVQ